MPRRHTQLNETTLQNQKNVSFEILTAGWFLHAGWQVFQPVMDNGHKTDLLISDGIDFYRIQIKTTVAKSNGFLANKWAGSNIDFVICFARNSNWGYIMPAFEARRKEINAKGHFAFEQNKNSFLKAFHSI